ncbi:MAG: helix-turn-helix domain-containing protein [Oscillospiraceae bacterium]|nr:helix-turn-helix domain-containing protein [Oscillospiraceae bacterium]
MLEQYKEVLTVKDLYEILPLGKNAIYDLIKSNKIKHIRVGAKIIIPKQYLIDYLKSA